jgi:inorganic triphosphatase YgiF
LAASRTPTTTTRRACRRAAIEIKLLLPESARRAFPRHPLLAAAKKLSTRKLVNVYFDTPDLALHRHAIELRTRKEGRDWLQTVKCAGSGSGSPAVRLEWARPYDGHFDFSEVGDAQARRLLEWHRIESHGAQVFETNFSRTTWRLAPAPETSVLLMLDCGLIQSGGASEEISEIELELERGDTAALFDLALALAASLPLQPAILSKAERGYRLHQGAQPEPIKADATPVRAGQSPQEAFRSVAAACLTQFQLNELGAASDDPEFIHQMRVALRRLRSALRVFRPILPATLVAAAVHQISTLAGTLGRARDRDVLVQAVLAPVRSAFRDDARIAALCAAAEEDRRRARNEARAVLATAEHARFLLSFTATLQALPPAESDEPIDAFAARRIGKLQKKLRAFAREAQNLDIEPLHALRVGVKRLRYAIEFFAPLYRAKSVKAAHVQLIALQDTLGTLTDLASAGAPLMQCAGSDPALCEAVALVAGWHGPRYTALRAELPERIGQLLAMKRFSLRARRRMRPR